MRDLRGPSLYEGCKTLPWDGLSGGEIWLYLEEAGVEGGGAVALLSDLVFSRLEPVS